MLYIGSLLALACAAAAAFFYTAEEMRGGTVGWANDACTMAYSLCLHPQWPAIAALVLGGILLLLKLAGVGRS
jgi:hypothetical protein